MKAFPPLTRRLRDHLSSPEFVCRSQSVSVGVRPSADGPGAVAVIKIDGCMDQRQADWVANRISLDVRTFLEFAN